MKLQHTDLGYALGLVAIWLVLLIGGATMRRLLGQLPLIRTDEGRKVAWSWLTHVAIGVGLGVAGWLVYLAALVQQSG